MNASSRTPHIAIVGGGPAGLMAAEVAVQGGAQVDVYDGMPSVGRKFLLAGKGGLNLTHGEPLERFLDRYGPQRARLEAWLRAFGPEQMRAWAQGLGIDTFVGSSGRVFPTDMKAAPLLRAWLQRLRAAGVRFHMRHRCREVRAGHPVKLQFDAPEGPTAIEADAVVLGLGGASWARLGSDGAWANWLSADELAPLRPSNCGFDVGWSAHLQERYAGQPLKSVRLSFQPSDGPVFDQVGECVVTQTGLEGSLVYAASAALRDEIEARGHAVVHLDLLPARSLDWVRDELAHPRGPRSLSTHLKSRLGLHGVKAGLLYEMLSKDDMADVGRLAQAIKALPVRVRATRPMDEAISTAGGVRFEALSDELMLKGRPGVFCAGEMLDWEAPTGGYLLTACFATGRTAGAGALSWLARGASPDGARALN
ncbi:TIGR03862 family flavoprotein [Piscinibacter sp. HJYY11]|uniref:TIGR03862 family flavoprotein n=1 Tax=Piscinibacter sp. HJYY11 TaxID=2801333 RepID=UPI00191E5D26|nr:TIGR03862 family flavoprotein [Piscinibacter sp. HJYY11]MBL0726850.1 TIGR03862 family flavoprotein [Piscinibacter sp. HJYY11]